MIYFVCPKCNRKEYSLEGYKEKCPFCEIDMIQTKYDVPFRDKEEMRKIEQIIFEEYVKDNPLYDPQEEKATQEKIKKYREECNRTQPMRKPKKNVPKCPTCGSTNVEPISTTRKLAGVFTLGLASKSVGKSYRCKNCNYYW